MSVLKAFDWRWHNFCLWKHGARSENCCAKWHFLVWNRARIWRTSHHRTVHPQPSPQGLSLKKWVGREFLVGVYQTSSQRAFPFKKWVVFKGKALGTRLPPRISQLWRIIVIDILISFSFLFWAVSHFRLSLLNNFYCEIFSLYNIVIRIINSLTSVNLKKAGMASQNIVINKRRYRSVHLGVVVPSLCEDFLCRARVSAAMLLIKGWLKWVKKGTWSHSGRCLVWK